MRHTEHEAHGHSGPSSGPPESLDRVALMVTLHCLTGCAIGEVAGMVIGTALGWGNAASIALSVALAFIAGFALRAIAFLRRGFAFAKAARIAFAAGVVSITVMEAVDNALMPVIRGAMDAPLSSLLF